jgi:competence protein ComFC
MTSLVAPPLCAICEAPVGIEERICKYCQRELIALGPVRFKLGDMEVISATRYERVARQLISKLKFSSRLALAEVAANAMVGAWGSDREALMVPVPASPARTRWRGFDTAWHLTSLISHRTWPGYYMCLERSDGPRQVGRSREDRIADPPRVRWARDATHVPDQSVWLIDDVVTTGATLLECERVLRERGVAEVSALTFARADSLGPRALAA